MTVSAKTLPVQVFGQNELLEQIESGLPVGSHLISIGNPRTWLRAPQIDEHLPRRFRPAFKGILRLEFFDLPDLSLIPAGRPRRIPELRDVRRVRSFYEQTKTIATGYTLHCWAGESRSPAIALGLLMMMTGSEEKASDLLVAGRKQACPHPGIVRLWDILLHSRLEVQNEAIRARRMREIRRALVQRSPPEVGFDSDEIEDI